MPTTKMNDKHAMYLRSQRRRYDKGLPSSHRPEELKYWARNDEDLAWFLTDYRDDLAESALAWADILFDWLDANKSPFPSSKSENLLEKAIGIKLSTMRTHKKNNQRGWVTYGEPLLELAFKRGYPDIFNITNISKEALAWANEFFVWLSANKGILPRRSSENPAEKLLESKLSTLRKCKKNNEQGWLVYGVPLMELAYEKGYPSIFETPDLATDALAFANELFDWMDTHEGAFPAQKAVDFVEKSLGSKLSNMKANKKNKQHGWTTYGKELLALAFQRGYPNVFDVADSTKMALEWVDTLFEWMDTHAGNLPKSGSKNIMERTMRAKLSNLRADKKNNKGGWPLYGSALLRKAKQNGYPNVFNRTDRTNVALEWANELFKWLAANPGRQPKALSKNLTEKFLGSKLARMRYSKRKNIEGWKTYGPQLLKLAKEAGYSDIFNTLGIK